MSDAQGWQAEDVGASGCPGLVRRQLQRLLGSRRSDGRAGPDAAHRQADPHRRGHGRHGARRPARQAERAHRRAASTRPLAASRRNSPSAGCSARSPEGRRSSEPPSRVPLAPMAGRRASVSSLRRVLSPSAASGITEAAPSRPVRRLASGHPDSKHPRTPARAVLRRSASTPPARPTQSPRGLGIGALRTLMATLRLA